MMEEGIGPIPEQLTTKVVNNLYEIDTEHLRKRGEYDKFRHHDCVIAT